MSFASAALLLSLSLSPLSPSDSYFATTLSRCFACLLSRCSIPPLNVATRSSSSSLPSSSSSSSILSRPLAHSAFRSRSKGRNGVTTARPGGGKVDGARKSHAPIADNARQPDAAAEGVSLSATDAAGAAPGYGGGFVGCARRGPGRAGRKRVHAAPPRRRPPLWLVHGYPLSGRCHFVPATLGAIGSRRHGALRRLNREEVE